MFIGIDVATRWLDLAATAHAPTLPRWVPNTAAGIAALIPTLRDLAPTVLVLEATGSYHRHCWRRC